MDEATRAWMYRGALVLIAVLIVIDVVRGGDATTWVDWLTRGGWLATAGLATANTSTSRDDGFRP